MQAEGDAERGYKGLEEGGCPGSDPDDEETLFDLVDDPSGHGYAKWANDRGTATITVLDES